MKNNFFKGFLTFFCVIVFAFSLLIVQQGFAMEVHAENPTPSAFSSGDGSEDNPWTIGSTAELFYLANQVNSVADFSKDKHFILTQNIVFDEDDTWTPIGGVYTSGEGGVFVGSFQGTFDGNGCKIDGMSIVNDAENPFSNMGLFGYTKNAFIKNLALENINMQCGNAVVTANQANINIGALIAKSENTEIRNCYVSDSDQDLDIVVDAYANVNIGGFVGQMNGKGVYDCFASLTVTLTTKSIYEITENIGGLMGLVGSCDILNSYSVVNLNVIYDQELGTTVTLNLGGLIGYVFESYSSMKNCFYVGAIVFENEESVVEQVGAIIGSLKAGFVPMAGEINYCHFVSNATKNTNINAFGNKDTYVITSLRFDKVAETIFKTKTSFDDTNLWIDDIMFDFQTNWTIQDGFPLLQQFLFYVIEVESNSIVTISFNSGEEIIDELSGQPFSNKRQFKAGQQVSLACALTADYQRFYDVDYWEKAQSKIVGTDDSLEYNFICSYVTAGLYSVELSPKLFSVSITVDDLSQDAEGNEYGKIRIDGALFQPVNQKMEYGRSLSLKAEAKVDYAFDGWYQGDTKISTDSQITLVIGSSTASFDENLKLSMTARFVRSTTKITITLSDNNGGEVKIEGDEEFSDETIVVNKIINTTVKLIAQPKEGFKFVGWYAVAADNSPLSKDLEYSYTLSEPEQSIYARFATVDAVIDEGGGLSGWAIFGIVGGSLALVGLVVGIIVGVKRKGSYKSNFNF